MIHMCVIAACKRVCLRVSLNKLFSYGDAIYSNVNVQLHASLKSPFAKHIILFPFAFA